MTEFADLIFLFAVTWLIIHELDAIHEREWRFFFMAISIEDETAYRIFVALHVPLLFFILWNIQWVWLQIPIDLFLIGHAGAHLALRNHRLIAFDTWFSWVWIGGGALIGAMHLFLLVLSLL
jgi:hypothetical protein